MGMREIAPFGVRIPEELKARIQRAAAAAGRSMNAEVLHRLQRSFEIEDRGAEGAPRIEDGGVATYRGAPDAAALQEHERRMLTLYRRLPIEKQLAWLTVFQ